MMHMGVCHCFPWLSRHHRGELIDVFNGKKHRTLIGITNLPARMELSSISFLGDRKWEEVVAGGRSSGHWSV